MDFLSTPDMGRRVPAKEEDVGVEVLGWELRQCREREEEQEAEAEELPMFLPTPRFMTSADEE